MRTCRHEWSLAWKRKKRSLDRPRGKGDDIKIGLEEIGCDHVNWNQVIKVCDQ
jgi:hypothetical protein